MRREFVKGTALLLVTVVAVSALTGSISSKAAAKTKLKTKSIVLEKGEKKAVKLVGKKKNAKYSYVVKKKSIVSVSAKGVVKGLKAGKTTITVYEKEKKKSKKKKVGTVQVKVLAKEKPSKTDVPATDAPSGTPQVTEPPVPTSAPTKEPPSATRTPKPTETPFKEITPGQTLKPATATSAPKTWLDEEVDTPAGFDKKQDGVTYGEIQNITYYSYISEAKRKAKVILPPNYDANKEYPVAYLLHGIGGDEGEWMGGAPDKIIGNMIAKGTAKEMILVLPNQVVPLPGEQIPSNIHDVRRYAMHDRIVEELKTSLMPFMETNYSVKPGRDNRAVCGLSMGGREAINVGIKLIDDFAYMGAFEPAYGVLPYERENGLGEDGLFTKETLTIPEQYRPISMFMIVKGKNDGVVNECPKEFSDALKANGVDHFYYVRPGGHDFAVWKNGLYNFARRIFQNS